MKYERMDSQYSGMIKEDKSAMANLPQSVVMKEYPKCSYMSGDLDDTMNVIDKSRDYDVSKIRGSKPDSKW